MDNDAELEKLQIKMILPGEITNSITHAVIQLLIAARCPDKLARVSQLWYGNAMLPPRVARDIVNL